MEELARKQQACLQEDRMDLFSLFSREREHLRSKIQMNDHSVGARNGKSGRLEAGERKQAMEMVEVIRHIQDIDTEIQKLLLRKKDELVSEIREIRKGKKAVKGYGSTPSARPARFLDQKG